MATGSRMHHMVTRSSSVYRNLRNYSAVAHEAKGDHQAPVKANADEPVYVVTLRTNAKLHEPMNALRTKYFPPERLHVGAHLTLFHALPESRLKKDVIPALEHITSSTNSFFLRTGRVQRFSGGVGIDIGSGQRTAANLRDRIKKRWIRDGWLSKQDRAKSKIHYTIMNKIENQEEIDRAMQEIEQEYSTVHGFANGLVLWKYMGPGWELARNFPFADGAKRVQLSGTAPKD